MTRSPSETSFADVALPLPMRQTFTYAVPPSLRQRIRRGCRVNVPFGSRVLTGFVVGLDTSLAPENPKSIQAVVDPEPLVDDAMLDLAAWIAERTLCSWGEALRATIPGHGAPKRERVVTLPARAAGDLFAGLGGETIEDRIIAAVSESGELERRALAKRLGLRLPDLDGELTRLSRAGRVRLSDRLSDADAPGVPRIKVVRLLVDEAAPVLAASGATSHAESSDEVARVGVREEALESLRRAPVQARCVEFLEEAGGEMPLRDLAAAVAGARGAIPRLVEKGIVSVRFETWEGSSSEPMVRVPEPVLNGAQAVAVERIVEALDSGEAHTFLLHGVTGSGKTEVYLRAMAHARRSGRRAILLVPEITLTPQTVSRLRGRFGSRAAVFHSRLTDAERRRTWHAARRGDYDVVLGPRSAVFAPLPDVGLIVIDEEHEGAYKQDESPRYQARDVAIERARRSGAVVLLGSATPDVETYVRAERGEFEILRLPERVSDLPLPKVRLVDLRGTRGTFSDELLAGIADRLAKKEQVILFLNRRGFSPFVQCGSCGEAIRCPECAVSLTFHKADGEIRCHYCDHVRRMPDACPECRAKTLVLRGAGTQRVEEELRVRFPEMRLARLDSDSVRKVGAQEEILGGFLDGEIDVLLGTQMVAKGLDFPRVTLVGVINADTGLHLPDYRSTERTFQLLTQVAGRAGRSSLGGEVLVQTRCPEHSCLCAAAEHDDGAFRDVELVERRDMRYPPFARLASILVRGPRLPDVERAAEVVRDRLAETVLELPRWAVVLGPAPATLPQLRGKHRVRLLVKGEDADDVRRVASRAFESVNGAGDVEVIVDVDPLDML